MMSPPTPTGLTSLGDSSELETADAFRLPGRYLFVAGINLAHRLNSPARHLPIHLASCVEAMDVVGYVNFYGGSPAPAMQRMRRGLHNLFTDHTRITTEGTVRRITLRRLHLPLTVLDMMLQDLWIYALLRGVLAPDYVAAIVAHPDNALLATLLKRSGRVHSLIYNDWDYFPAYVGRPWSALVAQRERLCLRTADAVVSVSRPLAGLRREQGARRVITIPNGVEYARFQPSEVAEPAHPPRLIYSGSLDWRWGIDLAIRALPLIHREYPDVELWIVGSGKDEARLRELAVELNVQAAVRFVGHVPYDDLPKVLHKADIGLATSRADAFRQYASPLKVVEYMAAGLPVIASGGGETALIIEESKAGLHVEFTPEAFASAVCGLLADPARLTELCCAGQAYARARDWHQLGKQLARFVATVTNDSFGQPTTDMVGS